MFDQTDNLDVLIVYSQNIAASASSPTNNKTPFSPTSRRSNYNDAYAYFLQTCDNKNIKAGLTTSADILSAGLCQSYWIFAKNNWKKISRQCFSNVIFDKFSPTSQKMKAKRQLLFSDPKIIPFNNPYLYRLFFDKLKSFNKLLYSSIPTVAIENNHVDEIHLALTKLKKLIKKHKQKDDFGPEVILKDRYGSGGFNIFKIDHNISDNIEQIVTEKKDTSFIIQPFTLFDQGYEYRNLIGSIDIRLIFMGTKIVQTYLRLAKKDDFRCNEHQGGSLTYIDKSDLPDNVIKRAQTIANNLNKPNSLYALDFIVSNNGNVYFLEGNCGPGVDWNLALEKNERMSKKLIHIIVNELKNRVEISSKSEKLSQPTLSILPGLN